MARREAAVGVTAIHGIWRFDRPVDRSALERFAAALRLGPFGRVVTRSAIGGAGDYWTIPARLAPVEYEPDVVSQSELEEWIDRQAQREISAYGGPAWLIVVAGVDDGGAVVSLLSSHVLADFAFYSRVILAAIDGVGIDVPARAGRAARLWTLPADGLAAARRVIDVVRAHRNPPAVARPEVDLSADPASTEAAAVGPEFAIPRVTAIVSRATWDSVAVSRGGTATVLGIAVTAAIASALGRTTSTGAVRMRMPTSTRSGTTDLRSNAVRGIEFDVSAGAVATQDLAAFRATFKRAIEGRASSPDPHEPMIKALILLSRKKLATTLANAAGTDYLGVGFTTDEVDPRLAWIDGSPSQSVAWNLVNRPVESPPQVATNGGYLVVAAARIGDSVAIRIAAFHPPNPKSRNELRQIVAQVLADYEIPTTFW